MRKTSVYLTADESEGLRQLSVRESRSQAELIREGVRRLIDDAGSKPRTFRSLGAGHGGSRRSADANLPPQWTSDELHRKAMGEQ